MSESELDASVWRYLTFQKFISLLTYGALWFPKLNILQDQFEGTLPVLAEVAMNQSGEKWKKTFTSPELQKQIDEWPKKNVEDGRELRVVSCWFLNSVESHKMWKEYVGSNEGVAIKSTIRKLATHIGVDPNTSYIGKVKYVDFNSHEMTLYEAHQACERSFLKSKVFSHEQEVRISTMSIKTPACVNINGIPYSKEEIAGKNMNNFENPGLYIRVHLEELLDAIVLAPKSPEWFELLVRRIVQLSKLNTVVKRSEIEKHYRS